MGTRIRPTALNGIKLDRGTHLILLVLMIMRLRESNIGQNSQHSIQISNSSEAIALKWSGSCGNLVTEGMLPIFNRVF